MNRDNLEKLANYLEQLPENYEHFGMWDFYSENNTNVSPFAYILPTVCGAVACAVGHAPAAGIPAKDEEDWNEYSDRVFELFMDAWEWCFSPGWAGIDDTPHGAARRIRHLLENGVPANAIEQCEGYHPYIFKSS